MVIEVVEIRGGVERRHDPGGERQQKAYASLRPRAGRPGGEERRAPLGRQQSQSRTPTGGAGRWASATGR